MIEIDSSIQGYIAGILFCTLISIFTVFVLRIVIIAELAAGAMSLGGSSMSAAPLIVLGGQGAIAIIMALLSYKFYNSNPFIAFLLNFAPLFVLGFLLIMYYKIGGFIYSLSRMRQQKRYARQAIEDFPYVHLEAAFVKTAKIPNGGVTMFIHIPFTLTKSVEPQSVRLLAPHSVRNTTVKYSSNPACNYGLEEPSSGFYIVEQEFSETPYTINPKGKKIAPTLLEPHKRYYLLGILHFTHSSCQLSDFDDFYPQQLNIKLSKWRPEHTLQSGFL